VEVVPVSIYVEPQGRRIGDIESAQKPTAAAISARPSPPQAAWTAGAVSARAVRHDQEAIAAPEALRMAESNSFVTFLHDRIACVTPAPMANAKYLL